jgi:hypothetical protein
MLRSDRGPCACLGNELCDFTLKSTRCVDPRVAA